MYTFSNVTNKNFPESHEQQPFLLTDKKQIPRCRMPAQRIPRFRPKGNISRSLYLPILPE